MLTSVKLVTVGGLHNAGTVGDADECKTGYSWWIA